MSDTNIDVNVEPVEPVTEPAAPVVIVNADDNAPAEPSAAVVEAVIENAVDNAHQEDALVVLQTLVETQAAELAALREEVRVSRETSELALSAAAEAEAGHQAPPEEDDVPKHEHPFFSPLGHRAD